MLLAQETEIGRKTAGQLTDELAAIGAGLMVEVLARWPLPAAPQPQHGVTLAPKIAKHEARLDFARSAEEVERQIRAFNPMPGAFFEYAGERIKIHSSDVFAEEGAPGTVLDGRLAIACGSGAILPTLVQRAGRGVMTPDELLRGFPIAPGTALA
jgi:methionyl-tRNA formyltransferase